MKRADLVNRLAEAERERNEARTERDEARENYLALVEEWKKSVFRLAHDRDEARFERDEFAAALRRIAGMYSVEKSTFQLACVAYEMSCVAKVVLNQEDEE